MTPGKIISFSFLLLLLAACIYYFYPEQKLPVGTTIDSLVLHKSKRELLVFSSGRLAKTYRVSLGGNIYGHKQFEGDEKTPEGVYFINGKNSNSCCYKNLGVSYPNETDRKVAAVYGKSAGGNIKIHGLGNGLGFIGKFQRFYDWTDGCIAVTDTEMEELYNSVKVGAKIEIRP